MSAAEGTRSEDKMEDQPISQWQLMLAGEPYAAFDPPLVEARRLARVWCNQYNVTEPHDLVTREVLLKQIMGSVGKRVWIEPPFQCDYGSNIHIGDGTYFNYNVVILDCAVVRIGAAVKLGPGVQIYTASHPVDPVVRREGVETAHAITIGDNVWIGGGSILCPGISIGDNSVIGAGSVVTRDIPANVVAVGNPCRVLRSV